VPPSIDGGPFGNLKPLHGANFIFGGNQYGYETSEVQAGRSSGFIGEGPEVR